MPPEPASPSAGARDPRIHRDPISGRTVFVAPQRAERPIDDPSGLAASDFAGGCPFCAGNEHLTPPDLLRARDAAGNWRARLISNRYPVVLDPGSGSTATSGEAAAAARGVHDVVIESPRHETSILAIEPEGWEAVWRLCRERLTMLAPRHDLAWATIFKNSGPRAGASLEHVHSQLVALDFVPASIHDELARADASPDLFGALLCEAEAGGRVVAAAGDLVALAPPAPRQPFETWIVPRHAARTFIAADDADVASLAGLTRSIIDRLQRVAPGSDYNWWLHQAPFDRACDAAKTAGSGYRWHLEIVPRLASLAGFELGTGCHITTLPPEEAAARLRQA